MSEFRKAMNDYRVGLNDEEIKIAFNTFDKRGDGKIEYEEFLREARVILALTI